MSESLFTTQTPSVTNASDGGAAGITTGTVLRFTASGAVGGIRFFSTLTTGAPSTYTAELWRVDGGFWGTRVASAVASAAVPGGTWCSVLFAAPVTVDAVTYYVAAVNQANGRYVASIDFWSAPLTNGHVAGMASGTDPLGRGYTVPNGVFIANSPPGVFPDDVSASTCYFVDALFSLPDIAPPPVGTPGRLYPSTRAAGIAPATATGRLATTTSGGDA